MTVNAEKAERHRGPQRRLLPKLIYCAKQHLGVRPRIRRGLKHYSGTNSIVVRTRAGSENPSTHFFDPLVGYFSPNAAVTASRSRPLRTSFALTGISSSPAWIVPVGSFLKADRKSVV